MTRLTLDFDVLAFKCIFGVPVMVEYDFFPLFDRVTGLALLAVVPLVSFFVVVLLVAGYALFRRADIELVGMAVLALDVAVTQLQLEFRLVVVERGFFPVGHVMALLTFFTEFAFVDVVLAVAGIA